jgi:rRNA-processing protein CGR1
MVSSSKKNQKDIDKQKKLIENEINELRSIPSGKVKSGRVWKDKSNKFDYIFVNKSYNCFLSNKVKNRFSNLVIQKPNKTSWDKKMKLKHESKMVKEHEKKLKEEVLKSRPVPKKVNSFL